MNNMAARKDHCQHLTLTIYGGRLNVSRLDLQLFRLRDNFYFYSIEQNEKNYNIDFLPIQEVAAITGDVLAATPDDTDYTYQRPSRGLLVFDN